MPKRKAENSEERSTASNRRSSRRKPSNEDEKLIPKNVTNPNRTRHDKKTSKPGKSKVAKTETMKVEDDNAPQVDQLFVISCSHLQACFGPGPGPNASLFQLTSRDLCVTLLDSLLKQVRLLTKSMIHRLARANRQHLSSIREMHLRLNAIGS